MQLLGGANAIENRDAETLSEPLERLGWKCLGGRHAETHRPERIVGQIRCEERCVERGDAEEQCGALARHDVGNELRRRWPSWFEYGGGADREREGERVAQAVGMEHRPDREADVVGGDPEDLVGVRLTRCRDIGVAVHRQLRLPGRPGCAEPKAWRLGPGVSD